MDVVTIPKKLAQKGDLVVILKHEYEAFSRWKKSVQVRLDEQWFWMPTWQKKEREAEEAIQAGKVKGPFFDHKELIVALKHRKKS